MAYVARVISLLASMIFCAIGMLWVLFGVVRGWLARGRAAISRKRRDS